TTRFTLLMCFFVMISLSGLNVGARGASTSSDYVPRDPILIDGNGDFTAANGVIGGSGAPSDPYIIQGWEIDASQASGIEIRDTDAFFVVRDARVHSGSAKYPGLRFSRVHNGLVENVLSLNNSDGISLTESANITIAGNTISHNARDGIRAFLSVNVTISANTIDSNGAYAILFWSSEGARINSNNVSSNLAGIYLLHSTEADLRNNLFRSNGVLVFGNSVLQYNSHAISHSNLVNGKPVYLYADCAGLNLDGMAMGQLIVANCTGVRVVNLHLVDTDVGIQMAFVDGAEITNNSFSYNWFGVHITSSVNILAHHNEFIDNTVQALDYGGSENAWDDGYPSGGNYWSDYAGADECGGPAQDVCPDPDGLGDVPYVIDANSQDRYPLMEPLTPIVERLVELVRRKAWPSDRHITLSLSTETSVALYARLRNLGDGDTTAAARFTITDEAGNVVAVRESGITLLSPGQIGETSATWMVPAPGRYSVLAVAIFDSDGDGALDASGLKTKTFGFRVV
ncbi:MAG: hypothetical protein GTO63_15040, partial [Anaerolineae bacterium]|nr:hypothetical protein [Anaerolineae bacterium]